MLQPKGLRDDVLESPSPVILSEGSGHFAQGKLRREFSHLHLKHQPVSPGAGGHPFHVLPRESLWM